MGRRIQRERGEHQDPEEILRGEVYLELPSPTRSFSQFAPPKLSVESKTDGADLIEEDGPLMLRRPGRDKSLELPLPARSFSRGHFAVPSRSSDLGPSSASLGYFLPGTLARGDNQGGRVVRGCPSSL